MLLLDAIEILELKAPFTAQQAKVAYRRLSMIHHPDKGGDADMMKALNEAFRLCSRGIVLGIAPKIDLNGIDFKIKKKKPSFRGVVDWFNGQMLSKLNCHEYKGFSWRGESANWLYGRMVSECVELRKAIREKDKDEIISEAADVANFAMMIADKARRML